MTARRIDSGLPFTGLRAGFFLFSAHGRGDGYPRLACAERARALG